jgi:hypothetical protein
MVAAGGTPAPLSRADLLPPEGIDLRAELLAYERDLLLEALDRAGSKRGAARLLGLTQMALYARLRRHDLRVPHDHWSIPEADCVAARAMHRAGYSHREIREYLALSETTVSHLLATSDPLIDDAARQCGIGDTP